MIFCNLAVIKINLRPSERQEHRIPNLRKALAVGCNFLSLMRILLILCFLVLCDCTPSNHNDTLIPKDYDYPEDSISNGKTFIYEDVNTGEQTYSDWFFKNKGKKKYLISTLSSNGKTYDSSIYLNDQMIETYSSPYTNGRLIKCEIVEDTIIKNKTGPAESRTTTILKSDSGSVISSIISRRWKDTIIMWRKRSIPCIIIRQQCKDEFRDIRDSTTEILRYYQNGYYGKNVGLIKYGVLFNRKINTIELKKIVDKK